MSHSPMEFSESLRIGTVDFISPDEVKVLLEIEAPDTVALNAGGVRPFPRVNGYVLVPVDDGHLVGQIEWLTVERSAFPKRRGIQDFGLIDLPYPLRKMSLNPLGILRKESGSDERYRFERGAHALPSVGSAVLLPTERQLRSIIEAGERRRVRIGTSPLGGGAEIRVDPDRMFGRHLAVLGNTGSGKSCSVAGLIRWCLESAADNSKEANAPNARFIVLDPNGEYAKAFANDTQLKAKIFKVRPDAGSHSLRVPLWLWNSAEWVSFTKASAKTQRPTLIQALRYAREGRVEVGAGRSHEMRRFLRTIVSTVHAERNTGSPWGTYPKPKSFFEKLEKWLQSIDNKLAGFEGDEATSLQEFREAVDDACRPKRAQYPHWDFTIEQVETVLAAAIKAHAAFGGTDRDTEPVDADAPLPFTGDQLVRCVEAAAEVLNVSEHVETLLIRLRALMADAQMQAVIGAEDGVTLESWLATYLGADEDDGAPSLSILDLSLVPSEVVHIVTAVTARLVFEALQRYRKLNGTVLPTVLVMEEAHSFVRRHKDDIDDVEAASVCCQVFERIAREGRKFGLGLVLSSQRPSELSPTVLSQCNTFLLHRISNDRDQELVHRLVPDSLRGLLRELPSLPSQHAIFMGWATSLPVLLRIDDLPRTQRPQSDDPDFWDVWTGRDRDGKAVDRKVRWDDIAADWRSRGAGECRVNTRGENDADDADDAAVCGEDGA